MTSTRTAWVTGSSAGIGRAIAQHLLESGWQVRGFDIVGATISEADYDHFMLDLDDFTKFDRIAAGFLKFAPPDALVHAAGVMRVGKLGVLQDSEGQAMWQLHVASAMHIANLVLPAMAQRGAGRMVLIGSRVASGMPGRSQCAATKAALVSLARSWAAEVVASGVTVNVVSPAATQTAMLDDPQRQTAAPRLPPIGRLIQPAEIAALVGYLLSPQAAAITGQEIQICGGASLSY